MWIMMEKVLSMARYMGEAPDFYWTYSVVV
jgi:hypothetical protein